MTDNAAPMSQGSLLSPKRRGALVVTAEMTATTLLVGLYLVARALVRPTDTEAAVQRTLSVVAWEQRFGLFREPDWQRLMLGFRPAVELANTVYVFGMHPVMLGIGAWLCARRHRQFVRVRRVLVVSSVVGVVAYGLWPAAPPRLLAVAGHDLGFVDTLHGGADTGVVDRQPGVLRNDYAALPSYHFAWVLLMAAGLWAGTRRWSVRLTAGAYCGLMWWAIVVTGNHLFVDMALGVLAITASWLLVSCLAVAARPWHAHQ